MKKLLAFFLIALTLAPACVPLSTFATTTATMITDKSVYIVGDPIMVTANVPTSYITNQCWVGIYHPDGSTSMFYTYVTSANNGVEFDISAGVRQASAVGVPAAGADIPAGNYSVRLIPSNSGSKHDAVAIADITIVAASGGTTSKLKVNKTTFAYDEAIMVTPTGSGSDWVALYAPEEDHYFNWAYIDTAKGGKGSGVAFDIKSTTEKGYYTPEKLPAGTYIIRLMPNGTSTIANATAWQTITILPETTQPQKPLSATYTLTDPTSGTSEGTLTVTTASGTNAEDIVCYWANASGKLQGYSALAKFKITGTTTKYIFPANILIPAGATKLLVYTSLNDSESAQCVEIALSDGAASDNLGTPIIEFQVISDTHITTDNTHRNNVHYEMALRDIATNSPNSTGIFVVGDMTNGGKAAEYQNLNSIYNTINNAYGLAPQYLALGNHDLWTGKAGSGLTNGTLEPGVNMFLQYAKGKDNATLTSCHYDFWQDGYHYIILGNDAYHQNDTTFSNATLTWLETKLQENRKVERPTFVFLHQSMLNTVAGSLSGQGMDGITNESAFKAILAKYPEVILFNGHSHWVMDSEKEMYNRTLSLPISIFNTSSVAYLWSSYESTAGGYVNGAEGFYVYVYKDKVVVRGRDFITGEWISSAQFVSPITYEVSFDNQGIGTTVSSKSVAPASKITLPSLTADGYTFEGWYSDAACTLKFNTNASILRNVQLYAKWTPITVSNDSTSASVSDDSGTTTPDDNPVTSTSGLSLPNLTTILAVGGGAVAAISVIGLAIFFIKRRS